MSDDYAVLDIDEPDVSQLIAVLRLAVRPVKSPTTA
jgi:hypothetical protein